ncbi:hypothetical protein DBV15_08146 [Temnothorax longispinosus]|uniref:Uncharacterized protein n=1 Tax=Temnothorax longispinosus TaxID=300112 RepID=A0A4S2L8K1_9HYME|nr:hypothetical protein DBV15_08146 [Temnothorax longispinosus]
MSSELTRIGRTAASPSDDYNGNDIQRECVLQTAVFYGTTASKYPGSCQGPPAASRPDTAGDRRHDTIRSSPSAGKLANKLLKDSFWN